MLIFTGWLVSSIIFGLITRYVSRCRGYDGGFAWGFFLGIIGLLVVGFKPVRGNEQHYVPASPDTASSRIGESNDALAAAKNQQKAD
jgi:predicted cobalt transporter CbtA